MHPQPPKWARKFLQWFCHPRLLEDMEGDLLELFHERVQTDGLANARRRYVWDVFRSLRPHHVQLKSVSPAKPLYLDMFRNYFLIALRQFWRNKVYSLLNVSGLAAGLAVSLLILVFVQHEFSYDRFHTRAERIYKMSGSFMYDGQSMNINGLGPAVAPALKDAHPEVVSFVRTSSMDRVLIGRGDTPEHRFREDKFLLADSSFLSVFSFRLLAGDPNTALTQPLSVLITPQMARKYFGEENPLGQTLSLILNPDPFFERRLVREVVPFTVSGIIEAPPSSSSLEYNFVASFQSIATIAKDQYDFPQLVIGNYPTYFLLNDASAAGEVTASLNQLVKPVMEGVNQHLSLEKLTDQHLHGGNSPANRNYLYIFAGVALLILLLALINYVSLTTARATQRSKEVGIRKVVGAKRPQLIAQFLGESFLMTLLAYVLAGGLVVGLLPVFQTLIGVSIPLTFLADFRFLLIALAVFLGSGLIAGTYPALLLSGLIPVAVLKGKFTSERGGAFLRRCFTTFQFAASVTLIICSLIMQNQLEFMRTTDIGLDKEHLLVIQLEAKNSGQNYRALTDELRRQSTVQWVTASTVVPFKGANMMFTETPDKKQISVCYNSVDEYFMDTFDIQWKVRPAGSPGKNQIVLNETAAQKLGLGDDPVGQVIPFAGENQEVAGVVNDFNFMSLEQSIAPLVLYIVPDTAQARLMNYGGFISIRLFPHADLPETLATVEKIYRKYEADAPFEYFFLDEVFDQQYKSQDRLAGISRAFTGCALLISCLGLFGLAAFTAERRTKEIGIRKVLGASAGNIIVLLSRDFLRLVLLSCLIAVPLAAYLMHRWLEEFAYRISMAWWVFALAGGLALLIALLTVSYQSLKAASANPVDSLRSE